MSGKMREVWYKIAAATVIFLFIALLIYVGINFPALYPDSTLTLEDKVMYFFERITLPIKIARLAVQNPDTEILMPVYGAKVSGVANTWLAPRPDGRVHEGQDIFAAKGTPVFSGTRGYVVGITHTALGGNSVSIVGAGGRRYFYTHLDRFADHVRVGQVITTDTVIGFVGNSGNAERTPPHLHVGMYQLGKALDLLPLLTDRPRQASRAVSF